MLVEWREGLGWIYLCIIPNRLCCWPMFLKILKATLPTVYEIYCVKNISSPVTYLYDSVGIFERPK